MELGQEKGEVASGSGREPVPAEAKSQPRERSVSGNLPAQPDNNYIAQSSHLSSIATLMAVFGACMASLWPHHYMKKCVGMEGVLSASRVRGTSSCRWPGQPYQ
jgi:hypothetical protein